MDLKAKQDHIKSCANINNPEVEVEFRSNMVKIGEELVQWGYYLVDDVYEMLQDFPPSEWVLSAPNPDYTDDILSTLNGVTIEEFTYHDFDRVLNKGLCLDHAGQCEVHYPEYTLIADDQQAAAQEYVDSGEWGDRLKDQILDIRVWPANLTWDRAVQLDEVRTVKILVHAQEPPCQSRHREHVHDDANVNDMYVEWTCEACGLKRTVNYDWEGDEPQIIYIPLCDQ